MFMNWHVVSRGEAERMWVQDHNYLFICFGSDRKASVINWDKKCIRKKYWQFDDVTEEDTATVKTQTKGKKYKVFNKKQAKEVVDFVEKNKEWADILIVHCDAGVSRSAGAMLAILEANFGRDVALRYISGNTKRTFVPNDLVYRLIMNEYRKTGVK